VSAAERALTPEEWRAYVEAPMDADERRAIEELFDWFTRRYPTPLERLRYIRRVMRRPLSRAAIREGGE
jgi:hypothetical protein